MVQAVIFDLDGLLVDSEPAWNQARRELAATAGQGWDEEDRRATMGVSTREWADYMIRRLRLGLSAQQVEAQIIARLAMIYAAGVPYLPGAIQAVELAARLYPTGVASGSPPVLVDIVTHDQPLAGKFQAIVCADRLARGKPAPDVYLAAARELGVAPEQCVCLEDSANGILAGKAAGMRVIAVPDPRFPPLPEVLEQADLVLTSLCDLTPELLGRRSGG